MNIKSWNWVAAFAHGASTVGLAIYFLLKKGDVQFNTDLFSPDVKIPNLDDPSNIEVTTRQVVNISGTLLKILVIIYFAFTTFFHIFYATDGFGTGAYTRAIANRNNYFRWIEYAISSTIMTFLIAIICGVKILDTVILLVFMNIGMILCGQIVEAASGPNAMNIKIVATGIGWVLLLGIVVILFRNFFNVLSNGKQNGYEVPTFVYFIIFPLVAWYASFGFVSLWAAFGKDQSVQKYLKVEKAYIFLSLFSKINLGYVIAFGLTRPKPDVASKNESESFDYLSFVDPIYPTAQKNLNVNESENVNESVNESENVNEENVNEENVNEENVNEENVNEENMKNKIE